MDPLLRKNPESIRRVALKLYRESNYGNALGYFLVLASLKHDWKETLLHYIISCLDSVCLQLERVGKHQELLRLYESTMEVYPSVGQLNRMLGECLFRQGHLAEAGGYLRCALSDSTSALYNRSTEAATRDTLDRINCRLVDRWHFTMLNDRARNMAFRRAIAAAVSELHPDDVVLDVGTGTAILSMMAVAAGAGSVYACDSSAVMCDVAAAVLADNCMSDKVHLINKHSSDLRPGVDIPKRVSLLVSETVDCGLFGEDVLNTVSDAWRHLLDPARGRVLPCRAAVHACLVQCDYVRAQFTSYDADGGDAWWRLAEPYWTEQLATVPGGYTTLTRDVTVLAVDFNDPQDVERCLTGGKDCVCELVASCEGRVDAVVAWFELWLSDDVALSTAPDPHCCWEQAVFPVYSTTVCLLPGQTVGLKVRCGDHLRLELPSDDGRVDLGAVPVDAEAVSYLNDLEYASWQLQQLSGWQPPASRSAAALDLTPHGRALDRLAGADVTVLDRGGSWSDMRHVVQSRRWDLVIHYPCLSSGLLDPALLQLLPQCRLADDCRVLPRHLVVWGVLVKSQLIVDMTSLDRVNTLGFDCSALGMYQVDMVQDVVVSPRTCQHVSPVCELGRLDLFSGEFATEQRFQLPVEPPDVAADALLFWLLPPGVSGVPARHRRHTALRCRTGCGSGTVCGTVQLMAHGLHITIADSQ